MQILPIRLLLLLGVLSLGVSAPVVAQDIQQVLDERVGSWTQIDRTEFGTIYMDTTQIQALDADIYQVRTRWAFSEVQTDHEGDHRYRSSVAVRAINCRSKEMAILAYVDLNGRRVVHEADQPLYAPSWGPVNPGSVVERIATWTCTLGRQPSRLASTAPQGG